MWNGIQKHQATPFELDNIICHSVILVRLVCHIEQSITLFAEVQVYPIQKREVEFAGEIELNNSVCIK